MPNLGGVAQGKVPMAQLSSASKRESIDLHEVDAIETMLDQLGHSTPCFVAGVLLVHTNGANGHGRSVAQGKAAMGRVFP